MHILRYNNLQFKACEYRFISVIDFVDGFTSASEFGNENLLFLRILKLCL